MSLLLFVVTSVLCDDRFQTLIYSRCLQTHKASKAYSRPRTRLLYEWQTVIETSGCCLFDVYESSVLYATYEFGDVNKDCAFKARAKYYVYP